MLAKRVWSLLFLAIAAFYLYGLGAVPLVGPDEPRYAQVAREMLARHDLITPTLGGLPWFEKPPLLYWMMMASYRVFGVSEFSARVGPMICGLLTAVFIYWIAARGGSPTPGSPDGQPGWGEAVREGSVQVEQPSRNDLPGWSARVFLSCLGVIAFSRAASFDIVLTMTLTGALACFFVWHVPYRTPTCRGSKRALAGADAGYPQARMPALLFAFYFFIGLSLLAKGLIGIVIPFGVIAVYFLLRRQWPNRKFVVSLFWGVPLTLAVAAVWYGPMISRHGWTFVDQFIIQHHFARFATNKYHHPAPFYFYLPVLAGLALPWTVQLLASFISARRWNWRGDAPLDRLLVFALAWIVVPVIFFSFSESKLTAYILPVMPAVALLIGERLTCFLRAGRGDRVMRFTSALLIALAVVAGWYSLRYLRLSWLCIGATSLPLVVVGATALLRPQMRKVLFVMIPLAMFAASAIAINCAAPVAARTESVRDLLAAANARGYGAVPVVQLHNIERTAEFYAAGRLDYGPDGEPIKLEGVTQVADTARRNRGVILCLVPTEYESQLTSYQKIQAEVIANNGRVSLVIVRVP
ncbi:MAG TPA: glycosyltransferase family 39 protein [Pyrinomonadaceae bacterium]|nr:glycosyltransferase family 39 protein [Pyrinomonadaceae bacterium]